MGGGGGRGDGKEGTPGMLFQDRKYGIRGSGESGRLKMRRGQHVRKERWEREEGEYREDGGEWKWMGNRAVMEERGRGEMVRWQE